MIAFSVACAVAALCWYGAPLGTARDSRNHRRPVRMVNDTTVEEIKPNVHEDKFPYVVAVRTYQTVGRRRRITRCTGTMMTAQLVLTTGYCVRDAINITVYKMENPLDDMVAIEGTKVIIKNGSNMEAGDEGKPKDLPNPWFYGSVLSHNNQWKDVFPPNSRTINSPLRNLAMIHMEETLYPSRKITFPVIMINPGNYTQNQTIQGNLYGWCQEGNNSANPSLTTILVTLTRCETDMGLTSYICMDSIKYRNMMCDMDQGGPVFLIGDTPKPAAKRLRTKKNPKERPKRAENEEKSDETPRLIAMVNTPRSYGHLIYMWPYADWVNMVIEEYATIEPSDSMNATNGTTHVDTYYEYGEQPDAIERKMTAECESSGIAAGAAAFVYAAVLCVVAGL